MIQVACVPLLNHIPNEHAVDAVLSFVTGNVDMPELLITFTGERHSVAPYEYQLCAVAATGVTSESARDVKGATATQIAAATSAIFPMADGTKPVPTDAHSSRYLQRGEI